LGLIDAAGRVVLEPRYDSLGRPSEGLVGARLSGKWGFIDLAGGVAVPFSLELPPGQMCEGRARVEVAGKFGFIDSRGELCIKADYDYAEDFAEGLAVVESGAVNADEQLFIRVDGSRAFPISFASAFGFKDGAALVMDKASELWGYIGRDGTYVVPPRFDGAAAEFSEGLAAVSLPGERFGYIDMGGYFRIAARFDRCSHFSEGVAPFVENDRIGFIDRAGNVVIAPTFLGRRNRRAEISLSLAYFQHGLCCLADENGKFGYIDHGGRWAIAPRFDAAHEFGGGLALVREGNCVSYLNTCGRAVWSGPKPSE
jgi:hypothetical protein